uniref:Uncharacterized protein n=1 Tax=Amphimedon queenslandica TaxID=400682 RepID=A0A1X7VK48_AMPQE
MDSEDDDGSESQEQQEDDKSTTNNITGATKDDCAEESLLKADDSDDGTLLPCELCQELFPILSIEEHQEYCRTSSENQELSTSGEDSTSSPVDHSTSTSSPVDHSTSTSSPVDHSTSTSSPVDQSTSTDSPTDQSTSTDSPVDQSTSASSPVDHSTSTNSDISNCSLPVDSSSVAMDTGNRYNGMTYSWNVTPNTTQRNSVDSVCAQLGTLQLSYPQQRSSKDQILMSMGGYGQCQHCKVNLLTCSVKYHEKICPVALNANPGITIYWLLAPKDGWLPAMSVLSRNFSIKISPVSSKNMSSKTSCDCSTS